ncbi:Fur family transcriptional regulator, ferric uptake regulator [Tepidimicrobium xylanilyticum]|uniref:Fur family transcriptional regulator, ferric uptake regulator n=2 Tax=Tepidimicrobium xylanilyticum TaxID=1123352 RepID=A0A1H2SIF5_9FIRM|nr:Fur family transcriptional regulator, ferric uptake regulator [Tepidimicrobium xylanilyticum]
MEEMKEKFKEEGYKLTTQRRAILDAIIENHEKHLSPEEVYDIVKAKYPEIGIATVYRTLQLLEKLNIIYRVNFDDGYNRYELCNDSENHQHHHLICLECGKVMEVKLDLLESLEKQIEEQNNFKIINHNVKFFGYCADCQV